MVILTKKISKKLHKVDRFIEKPNKNKAKEILKKNGYMNSGMFFVRKDSSISENIGIMLPNTNTLPILFFALQFISRVPAMLNFSSGAFAIRRACETAQIKIIYTSKLFIEKAKLENTVKELNKKY